MKQKLHLCLEYKSSQSENLFNCLISKVIATNRDLLISILYEYSKCQQRNGLPKDVSEDIFEEFYAEVISDEESESAINWIRQDEVPFLGKQGKDIVKIRDTHWVPLGDKASYLYLEEIIDSFTNSNNSIESTGEDFFVVFNMMKTFEKYFAKKHTRLVFWLTNNLHPITI